MTQTHVSSSSHRLRLSVLPVRLAVCYLMPDASVPLWATHGEFYAVTRTRDELSIVCDFTLVPPDVVHEGPWACLQVAGPLDFALTGILVSLAAPLARAGISIFAVSTYRTDYLLVPEADLDSSLISLRDAGHSIR